jgi:hypothetical protein
VFGNRHGDASSISAHAKPVASVLRKRFGLVAAFALTHEWNFLVRIPLKLRSSFSGEKDVQTIFSAAPGDHQQTKPNARYPYSYERSSLKNTYNEKTTSLDAVPGASGDDTLG